MACAFAAGAAWATDYYVATDGDDANDGLTRATAKKDLAALVPTLSSGSTVYVYDGTYEIKTDWMQLTNDVALVGRGTSRDTVILKNTRTDKTNGKRILKMAASGARLENFTLTDGYWESYQMKLGDSPAALSLSAGTVSNCVIKASTGSDLAGGAIGMSGGLITHSVIWGNKAYRASNAGQKCTGGGIKLTGGILQYCVFSNNTAVGQGGAIYQTGGTNRFNRITLNKNTNKSCAAVYISGGLMERCEIDNSDGADSTIAQAGGTVRNCFVHDNIVTDDGGGITQTGGILEYCTFVNNSSKNLGAGGIFLNKANATARYNVTYLNGDTGVNPTCNLKVAAGTSTDNISTDPSFVNSARGDFTLGAGSSAIDLAPAGSDVTADFAGNVRPKDGDGDGIARNDAGCYEAKGANEGELRCSLSVTGARQALDSLSTSFKASVAGVGSTGTITYYWDFDGDGVVDEYGTDKSTPSHQFTTYGYADVTLWVSNGTTGATFTYPQCVGVGSKKVYVNAANAANAKWPYATWETAAADINEAFGTMMVVEGTTSELIVTNGTYDITSKWLMLNNPVVLRSVEGPTKTILRARNTEATNKRRVLLVNNKDAFVHGFKMTDGNWQAYNWGDDGPGALRLIAGVVSNCIFTANAGHVRCSGAAEVRGGLLTHSLVYGNSADYGGSSQQWGKGGGVWQSGGFVEHCVISNNYSIGYGGGLYLTGGTNRHNRICKALQTSYSSQGVYISGGLLELCEIDANKCSSSVIEQSGGTIRNCFIHDNYVTGEGGGATLTGGTIEYCTLVNNTSEEAKTGGIHLNQASGKTAVAQYNVTYLNGDPSANPTCNLKVSAGTSTGNVATDPSFANPNTGDFTLASGSTAIDAAEEEREDVVVDFAGNMRPKDGNGDNVAANDCGCFEAKGANEGPMRCSFTAEPTRGLNTLKAGFAASVAGEGSEGPITYYWDFDGDGAVDLSGTGDAYMTPTNLYTSFGYYDVTLWTSNGTKGATFTYDQCAGVGAQTVYVNAANAANAEWPYATWETAASDLNVAYGTLLWVDGFKPEIIVTNGSYDITSKWLILKTPITLRSIEGPEKTILRARNTEATDKRRVLNVNHDDVLVSGFKLTEANWQAYNYGDGGAGALRLEAGVVTNCIIAGNSGSVECSGGAQIQGGLLTHCIIRGNRADQGGSSWAQSYGGGLRVSGGTVEHCVITNNYSHKYAADTSYGRGSGLYLCGADAIVRDCVIGDNYSAWQYGDVNRNFQGSQVYVTAGLLERCTIGDMKHADVYACGVYQTGGTIRNCLLKGMYSGNDIQALELEAGMFVNNTVVTNGASALAPATAVAAKVTGGTMVNCIVSANACPNLDQTAGSVTCTYTGDAPRFRNPQKDDWRLRHTSPCVDTGDWTVLGATKEDVRAMYDLLDTPRLVGGSVDMGCYENNGAGMTLIIR